MNGKFTMMNCDGETPLLVVRTDQGEVKLRLDKPRLVTILRPGDTSGSVDLNCGEQPGHGIEIGYTLDGESGEVRGSVRTIRFLDGEGK